MPEAGVMVTAAVENNVGKRVSENTANLTTQSQSYEALPSQLMMMMRMMTAVSADSSQMELKY